MQEYYIIMVIALFGLAITDLVVGVSNDAVNFLNSAFGSKAAPVKTIMIVASFGIAIGATFSSGMMEVARKGIMDPSMFEFSEIMLIFMAVMISDIILLDVFNSLGLPTSTTVSIVFELLGASVSMALYKISKTTGDFSELSNYINSDKALLIISGILLSVVIAFTVGAIVQYISRLLFTFQYEKKIKSVGPLFGGFAFTAITYFILIKGLKGTSLYGTPEVEWILNNTVYIVLISFVIWSAINYILVNVFKLNILKLIVVTGTFAVALAFAGNDLVNFIGVPMAGLRAFELYVESGYNEHLMMSVLASEKTATPAIYLFAAGAIMVLTLWFSKKAKSVSETELSLARQDEGAERFQPNFIAKAIVRGSVSASKGFDKIIPISVSEGIDARFDNKTIKLPRDKSFTPPAFDLVRASVNVVMASILISIGTSFKLPLSTTYVTFMVAMGTSLADRAWDRESAVYRVAGVLNVVAGWFSTAFSAFTSALIMTYLMNIGGMPVVGILLVLAIVLITRSYILHSQKMKETDSESKLRNQDRININEIIDESSENISKVISSSRGIYSEAIDGLSKENRKQLKKNKKENKGLKKKMEALKGNVFYFIKSMDETSVESSKFYIMTLDHLQDITQSISYVSKASFDHVDNQHKALKPNQIEDLKNIDTELTILFNDIEKAFSNKSFNQIDILIKERKYIENDVSNLIEKQITLVKTEDSSPKNSMLYFSILLETKDLIEATWNLLNLHRDFYTGSENKKK
ncbi:MAG: inorganic phosphate transporter [Ichthyobacteriaceae bacterium]|nr:inorganic phosphate transporter [Ichthyobacteriaceae bacterium]